ncbi:MAG: hypothetical protein JWM95_2853 [Gemmatimonadetes bacterium]|nr:hypothetical protein [Gemmatimonadota bacterium]
METALVAQAAQRRQVAEIAAERIEARTISQKDDYGHAENY